MELVADYGLQLWPMSQDMSQLRDLYGGRASTFVAISGVNDFETAKWLSKALGKETIGYQTENLARCRRPAPLSWARIC